MCKYMFVFWHLYGCVCMCLICAWVCPVSFLYKMQTFYTHNNTHYPPQTHRGGVSPLSMLDIADAPTSPFPPPSLFVSLSHTHHTREFHDGRSTKNQMPLSLSLSLSLSHAHTQHTQECRHGQCLE